MERENRTPDMILANNIPRNTPCWATSVIASALRGVLLLNALALPLDHAKSAKPAEKQKVVPLDFQRNFCVAQTSAHEKALGIPNNLLTAVSLAETGRWDAKRAAMFAWPWTVTARGKGHFYPTKSAAIAEVRKLQAAGIKNIDVGCMQINLYYHPNAFENLNEAFEPAANVNYASRFLRGLHAGTQSWPQAAANYHSSNPIKNQPYLNRVLGIWQKVSKRSIRSSGFTLSPDLAYQNPLSRDAQLAVLNSRFRARLAAERSAEKPKKRETQIDAWRRGRFNNNYLSAATAKNQANLARSRKKEVNQVKTSFAERRRRQMVEWKKRRNGSVFH